MSSRPEAPSSRASWPAPDEVHVHVVPQLAGTTLATTLLDEDERYRMERLRSPASRSQFVHARIALRRLLGGYLGVPPAEVRLSSTATGKPVLAAGALNFNLSHTKGLVVIALACGREVGVDCERPMPLEPAELLRTWASAAEQSAWAALPQEDRAIAFWRAWTRKEAVLKAWSEGFGIDPARLSVPLAPGPVCAVVDPMDAAHGPCQLLDLELPLPWVGAVAMVGVGPVRLVQARDSVASWSRASPARYRRTDRRRASPAV